jgi:murein DD-endopeptidase MepM/ murein hydrolase activator NlpD
MKRSVLPVLASTFLLTSCLFGSQTPAPLKVYGFDAGAGSSGVHTVTEGENLWSISNRYNIVMQDIVLDNRLAAPFVLVPGQRLKLPPPREYLVRSGDSLYSVSRIFNADMSQIARLNDLQSPYVLRAGQRLKLPSESAMAPPERAMAAVDQRTYNGAAVPSVDREPISSPPQKSGEQKVAVAQPQVAAPKQPKSKVVAKTPKRSSSKFMKPVSGKILSKYGPKAGGLHNDGINILAARGTPVKAAENGVVVYAGNELKGSGNLVLVRHENRWMTAYAHLDKISVARGAVVNRGASIGTVGSTGSVDRPQLHFEVRRGTEAINPEVYLER